MRRHRHPPAETASDCLRRKRRRLPNLAPEQTTAPSGAGATPASSLSSSDGDEAYQVLARKYRPQNFAEVIGQEALVQHPDQRVRRSTRVAHAFMLTGVRGVGKTTHLRGSSPNA